MLYHGLVVLTEKKKKIKPLPEKKTKVAVLELPFKVNIMAQVS
jgi:hypothetical protein